MSTPEREDRGLTGSISDQGAKGAQNGERQAEAQRASVPSGSAAAPLAQALEPASRSPVSPAAQIPGASDNTVRAPGILSCLFGPQRKWWVQKGEPPFSTPTLHVCPLPPLAGALGASVPSRLSLELVLLSAGSTELASCRDPGAASAPVPGPRLWACPGPGQLYLPCLSLPALSAPQTPHLQRPPAHLTLRQGSPRAPGSPFRALLPVQGAGQMRPEGRAPPVAGQLCPNSSCPWGVFPRQPGGDVVNVVGRRFLVRGGAGMGSGCVELSLTL